MKDGSVRDVLFVVAFRYRSVLQAFSLVVLDTLHVADYTYIASATFTFLSTISLNTPLCRQCVYSRQGLQHSASQKEKELALLLHTSVTPLLPHSPSLLLLIPASLLFPFSLVASQAAVLFWVTGSDEQVTKAPRCLLSTLPAVSRCQLELEN